jgi:putative methylase
MNKKRLAVELSKLEKVEEVNPGLEQYPTDSELAAQVLWNAFMNGDIEDKVVADLGCGNGIFGIGALMLGAEKVYFVDLDKASLEVAKRNCEFENVEFLNVDVMDFNEEVDSVVMNPPFGVQNVHADRGFLEKAMEVSKNIYSIHKIESKKFIDSLARDNGFGVIGFEEREFVLKKSMKFHKSDKYMVRVGLWVIKRKL